MLDACSHPAARLVVEQLRTVAKTSFSSKACATAQLGQRNFEISHKPA